MTMSKKCRIHVVPVGASLTKAIDKCVKVPLDVKQAMLPAHFSEANPAKRVQVELLSRSDEHGLLDLGALLHRDSTKSQEVLDGLATLCATCCAEWNSLSTMGEINDDVLLFVASDTDVGLRAAVLAAAKYAQGRPIRYVADPLTGLPTTLKSGQIVVARIPGLDLNPNRDQNPAPGKKPDDDTWLSLGDVGAAIARTASRSDVDWEVMFHLSGGYKALLPYLLVVAEGVQTVVRKSFGDPRVRVRAQVLHEEGEQPVRLPLRWLSGDSLLGKAESLVIYAEQGVHVDESKLNDFRGWYLEDDTTNGRRRLTEAGMIMVRTLWALTVQ
ncbi:hypothetical protein [Actinokineospora sp.]|uniref:hypothetical protein n=1 Tax=Actinokineospora sp. TaxID=1872133 RepID=UPI004037AE96